MARPYSQASLLAGIPIGGRQDVMPDTVRFDDLSLPTRRTIDGGWAPTWTPELDRWLAAVREPRELATVPVLVVPPATFIDTPGNELSLVALLETSTAEVRAHAATIVDGASVYEIVTSLHGLELTHHAPRYRDGLQDIRSASAILTGSIGAVTCLDLTLVVTALLEALGEWPVIGLVRDTRGRVVHAVPGRWLDRSSRYRTCLDGHVLSAEWKRGAIEFAESTSACANVEPTAALPGPDPDRWIGLDVTVARPPTGTVGSISGTQSRVAQRAGLLAFRVASRCGSAHVESVHLLHGVCAEPGPVAVRLLASLGVEPSRIREVVESGLSSGPGSGPVRESRGHAAIWAGARALAANRGTIIVDESDLWWSIVDSRSRNVHRALRSVGAPSNRIAAALSRIAPRPGVVSDDWRPPDTEG